MFLKGWCDDSKASDDSSWWFVSTSHQICTPANLINRAQHLYYLYNSPAHLLPVQQNGGKKQPSSKKRQEKSSWLCQPERWKVEYIVWMCVIQEKGADLKKDLLTFVQSPKSQRR